jgi:hypothetical protein
MVALGLWRLQEENTRVRVRWVREDGLWLEIRQEGRGKACWLVDQKGLHERIPSFAEALDAAYRRQAELDTES